MSGICGVVRLDRKPSDTAELRPMLAAMAGRGPDGSSMWTDGIAALGFAKLATTPEAVAERLPLTHPPSGCTIVADVRLDNRDELIPVLAPERPSIGDGELTLLAYLKWAEDCVDRLVGNFALAIWDPRRRRLFAARDHMGARQLSFAKGKKGEFVFATDPAAVAAHPAVERRINEERIADFLDGLDSLDHEATFYAGVSRLKRAHWLSATREQIRLTCYWTLETPEPLILGRDGDYADALAEQLERSVSAHLRSAGPVGSMLSGGLDSTSVVAVGADLLVEQGRGPLHVFSVTGPDPAACPETRAIREALKIPGIAPHVLDHSAMGHAFAPLSRMALEVADPFEAPGSIIRATYWMAQQAGVRVVLDGVTSDLALGPHSHIPRLLRRGRLLKAAREARLGGQFWGPSWPAASLLKEGLARAFVPIALRRARRAFLAARRDRSIGRDSLISRQFAKRIGLVDRRRRWRQQDCDFDRLDRHERTRRLSHVYLTACRERLDQMAGRLGVEARDPFLDIRLINFCLSLPEMFLQRDGWPKILLREAMAGRVPDPVRWRLGRDNLGGRMSQALLLGPSSACEMSCPELKPFVDVESIATGKNTGGRPIDNDQLMELLCLGNWIRFFEAENR